MLEAQGDLTDALKSYQAGLVVRQSLVKAESSNGDRQHELSVSYAQLATVHLKAQETIKAREALSAGRDIIAGLQTQFPDRSEWKQDLSWFDQQIAALKSY